MDDHPKRFREWDAMDGRQEIVSPETVPPRHSLRELQKLQEDLVDPGGPIEDTVKLIEFPDEQEASAGAGAADHQRSPHATPAPEAQQPAPKASAIPEILPDYKVIG